MPGLLNVKRLRGRAHTDYSIRKLKDTVDPDNLQYSLTNGPALCAAANEAWRQFAGDPVGQRRNPERIESK